MCSRYLVCDVPPHIQGHQLRIRDHGDGSAHTIARIAEQSTRTITFLNLRPVTPILPIHSGLMNAFHDRFEASASP